MVQKWSARGNIVRRFETSVKSAAEMHSIIIIIINRLKKKVALFMQKNKQQSNKDLVRHLMLIWHWIVKLGVGAQSSHHPL